MFFAVRYCVEGSKVPGIGDTLLIGRNNFFWMFLKQGASLDSGFACGQKNMRGRLSFFFR